MARRNIWGYFGTFLASGLSLSIPGGAGIYFCVTQSKRYRLMEDKFEYGNLLPPYGLGRGNIAYFERPLIEKRLRAILQPTFSSEYYLICGVVGCGKTRSVVEVVRKMMSETKSNGGGGAPIYVIASQGRSFPDSLAAAIDFRFDEHLTFKYFRDWAFRINTMPSTDADEKLTRILAAIEESASLYVEKKGRPVVIVIDGLSWIKQTMPGALERLAQKAKLWADTNIVKMVFVTTNACLDDVFIKDTGGWSRAGKPVYIGDLTDDEAITYLRAAYHIEPEQGDKPYCKLTKMSNNYARKIVDLVGGRIQDLSIFKRDFMNDVDFADTEELMVSKERAKLMEVSKFSKAMKAVKELSNVPSMRSADFVDQYSEEVLTLLEKSGIVKQEKLTGRSLVMFESKLTESVVKQVIND